MHNFFLVAKYHTVQAADYLACCLSSFQSLYGEPGHDACKARLAPQFRGKDPDSIDLAVDAFFALAHLTPEEQSVQAAKWGLLDGIYYVGSDGQTQFSRIAPLVPSLSADAIPRIHDEGRAKVLAMEALLQKLGALGPF